MYAQNLATIVKVTQVFSGSVAATTARTTTGVDMTGYDGVMFVGAFGTGAANQTVQPVCGTTSASASLATAITGNLQTGPGATSGSSQDAWSIAYSATGTITTTDSSPTFALDVKRPMGTSSRKYIGLIVTPTTSSTISAIFALQYRASAEPVVNSDGSTVYAAIHQAISNA
jgi:hypothetical protein